MSGLGKIGMLFTVDIAALFDAALGGAPGVTIGNPWHHRNGGTRSGGARSGVAAAKRARHRRRNIAKHPRGAA